MSNIKSILKSFVILGVLVFAIMNFVIIIQQDNGVLPENRITNNSAINEAYGDLSSSLNQQSTAEGSLNSLEDVPPEEYIGDLNVASTVSTTRAVRSIVIGLWNIYVKLPMVILGVSPVVSGAITTILLIFIALSIWFAWKGSLQ